MTEIEATRILDEIRTAAAFLDLGRRPAVTRGQYRYELRRGARVWTWRAVGKSGLRWALEPGDDDGLTHHVARVRELAAEVVLLEVKRGSQKADAVPF